MRRNLLTARAVGRPALAVLAAVGVTAGILVGWPALDTVNGCGLAANRYPSGTAQDWVRYADVVVVGRAVRERESGRRKLSVGAYGYQLQRTVELTVQAKPFTSGTRTHPAVGASLDYEAAGWRLLRSDGTTRVPDLTGDAPRVIPGHTYILALRWEEERWVALGEGAVVPFDGQVVGRGEWCGRIVDTDAFAQGERTGRSDDHSLEKTLLGQGEPALDRALRQAARQGS
ncbi:hypothetical protein SAMN04487983_101179 [Streptomyces sp. yr375]|uniref:hypothetical protein n=1 Tax=Streptomyces sp. yr375 TaxID=1761906 RepID=UPI0008D5BAF6|nr:hypothetical protein [Streptomyces sp. yr375]SER10805.1 hypothetical protein SAMN04487983_101179 [Streptomyces sp. yr375]